MLENVGRLSREVSRVGFPPVTVLQSRTWAQTHHSHSRYRGQDNNGLEQTAAVSSTKSIFNCFPMLPAGYYES